MILPLIRSSLAKVLGRVSLGFLANYNQVLAQEVEERTAELSQINKLPKNWV